MSTRRKSKKSQPAPKKTCSSCGKEKSYTSFYKVNSPLFPDGMINICSECVREQVDIDNIEEVISFLRQIDKPFIEQYWNEALQSGRYPLGEYVRKVNSLQQVKDKNFDYTKTNEAIGRTSDVAISKMSKSIESENGKVIEFSDDLITKWGMGYKKHEYLKMEKFYQDMKDTHDIRTPIHKDMLIQLAKLSIKRDRYLEQDNMSDYEKANKAFETTMKSAGFRPIDRKGIEDSTGIRTFSQVWEEVEKRGWRKPPPVTFEEDVIDGIIISLANYYHRLVGQQILTDVPDSIKQELEDFYEFDDTPVEINDEEYEDLDFSMEDEEEDE